jgi:nicotinamide mononucleotide transporter
LASILETVVAQLTAWTLPEAIAVIFAILYLLLAIRENIWCWICAGISTAIYIWLFMVAKLYMESLLNVFYFGMAIYGWTVWSRGHDGDDELPVAVWPLQVHGFATTQMRRFHMLIPRRLSQRSGLRFWLPARYLRIGGTGWLSIWFQLLSIGRESLN